MFQKGWRVAGLLLVVAGVWGGELWANEDRFTMEYPGYLIIEAAQDTSVGFSWHTGPAADELSLVWSAGVLTIPDDLPVESFGEQDLAIEFSEDMSGLGGSGRLVLKDGDFDISEPLTLSDGHISLQVVAGRLKIQGQRIKYRSPDLPKPSNPQAGYVFLAGMVVLVVVLLRRARIQARKKA